MQDAFPRETAGHRMVTRVPVAQRDATAEHVRLQLHGGHFDCVDLVCVVDHEGRLDGVVPLTALLAARAAQKLTHLMILPAPSVTPEVDQERIASLALHHGVNAIAVTDGTRKFLGLVPAAALIRILRHEHVEDLHRLAGIARETDFMRGAIEAPPTRRVRDRLPWLAVGLVGSFFATWVMASFEHALKERVAIAFFVPGLVYLADAVGTQTEAIAVRGLSLSHAPIGTLLVAELRTGSLIGLVLGLAALVATWIAFGDLALGVAVSVSLAFAAVAACGLGLVFPWALQSLGKDPAYGSGPIATVTQDILTLAIYFCVVYLVLG
jgi:magnesium transporter